MLTTILIVVQVVLGYAFVDAFSGIYHALTDSGYNIRHQLDIFEDHHKNNAMLIHDWSHCILAVPLLVAGLWLHSPLLISIGFFGVLGQLPHYYAHTRSKSAVVHRIVRFLQKTGIIISPQYHATHHDGQFNRNFCIVSGWNDWWINWLYARCRK